MCLCARARARVHMHTRYVGMLLFLGILCPLLFSHVVFWEIQVRFSGKDQTLLSPLCAPDSKATFCFQQFGVAAVYGDISVYLKL